MSARACTVLHDEYLRHPYTLCASLSMAHERFIRTLLNVLLAKDLCPASLDAEELRRAGGLVGGDALRTCFVSLEAQG